MKVVTRILMAGLLVAAILTSAQRTSAAGSGAAAFDQLKALIGHWETEKTNTEQATFDMELTAGGTALLEKFHMVQNGKPVEMTTLYYLDGGQLKMTHYCMAGNQPTMRATYAPESKTLTFDFESATNMKSANDGHMHHAVYTFIDQDHLKTQWTFHKDQKPSFTEDVIYVRVK
jgi:hypothetical protein